jgi:enterochelin esterase-like enzyme
LLGCAGQPPRVETTAIASRAMNAQMRYSVWAPSDLSEDERLPLVVFLHGSGDDHLSFDTHGISGRLDEAVARGSLPRVVIALPEGHTGFWTNWADGTRNYEDWVTHEVMPAVARDYHTRACPDECHVMGVSMGGAGVMQLVFHRPGLFASASLISAMITTARGKLDLLNDRGLFQILIPTARMFGRPPLAVLERDDPFIQWQDSGDVPVRLFVAWAAQDRRGMVRGNRRLVRHLDEHEIAYEGGEFPGGHNWVSWGPVIVEAIGFVVAD